MKKTLAPLAAAITSLALAVPAFAENIGVPKPPSAQITNLGLFISRAINVILIISGILIFVYLVFGGIRWLTSGGDKNNVQAARDVITHALIGLAIIAAAWALAQVITHFFGLGTGLGGSFDVPTAF